MLKSNNTIIDIRDKAHFKHSHLEGSYNLDVGADSKPNPYKHTATLVWLFDVLKEKLSASDPEFGARLDGKTVILLSRDGNVARLACSILRNRGVEAFCVVGGIDAMAMEGLWPPALRARL
jgi:rhodanese-related sulfurtransferase